MGVDIDVIARGLGAFKGLSHRLEFIIERGGVRFYNDSKATTPESTVAAVTAFEGRVIPILGGYDKGVSFDDMAESIKSRAPWAALIGRTAPAIGEAFAKTGVDSTRYESLEDALDGAVARARQGDVVVLTPGCASYDMFSDYENRGELFRELVRKLMDH